MPIFSLPLGPSSERNRTQPHLQPRISRKRKRTPSHDSQAFNDYDDDDRSNPKPSTQNSPLDPVSDADLTNPLSLSPADIQQYRLAGLSLNAKLPSVKDWPHRTLSRDDDHDIRWYNYNYSTDVEPAKHERLEEAEDKRGTRKPNGPMLRMHHISVLTTLLHKCLMDGDISRATRAWALLLRMQVGGLGIDVRGQGYWGIGAEVLVRAGEKAPWERRWRTHTESGNIDLSGDGDRHGDGNVEEYTENSEQSGVEADRAVPTRWGTEEGLARAREYYERLVLQYPYRRQFSEYMSALDFWPAMLGCEIYGVHRTHQVSLAHIDSLADDPNLNEQIPHSADDQGVNCLDEYSKQIRHIERERARKDKLWRLQDDVRLTTLRTAETIAKRMSEQMAAPPYSDSAALLRLQGMLALYIADLSVPEMIGEDEVEDDGITDGLGASARRTVLRQRRIARRAGLEKQKSGRIFAKETFRKAGRAGARLGPTIWLLMVEDGDDKGMYDS